MGKVNGYQHKPKPEPKPEPGYKWCSTCKVARLVDHTGQSVHCQAIDCAIGNAPAKAKWTVESNPSKRGWVARLFGLGDDNNDLWRGT